MILRFERSLLRSSLIDRIEKGSDGELLRRKNGDDVPSYVGPEWPSSPHPGPSSAAPYIVSWNYKYMTHISEDPIL